MKTYRILCGTILVGVGLGLAACSGDDETPAPTPDSGAGGGTGGAKDAGAGGTVDSGTGGKGGMDAGVEAATDAAPDSSAGGSPGTGGAAVGGSGGLDAAPPDASEAGIGGSGTGGSGTGGAGVGGAGTGGSDAGVGGSQQDAQPEAAVDAEAGVAPIVWRAFFPLASEEGADGSTERYLWDTHKRYFAQYDTGLGISLESTFGDAGIASMTWADPSTGDMTIRWMPAYQPTPVVDFGGSYSVSVWATIEPTTLDQTLVAPRGVNISAFWLQRGGTSGKYQFLMNQGDDINWEPPCGPVGATTIDTNVIHHVVATRDGTTGAMNLYVDGAADATVSVCTKADNYGWGGINVIGVGDGYWDHNVNARHVGSISGLGLIDRVLTAEEVSDLYSKGPQHTP